MLELLPYHSEQDRRLDNFISKESINGTFLQSRRFLGYHPADRFQDASFAIEKSGIIAAYFPGNVTQDGEFISHQGSTFGGPVFSKNFYTGSRVQETLEFADSHFAEHFKKVRLKLTPTLFSKESPDLIEYTLEHLGYTRHTELSAYTALVDTSGKPIDDPLKNCDMECRRIYRFSEKFELEYRPFRDDSDLEIFYRHLEISKAKHNARPVHTLEELKDLQQRLNFVDDKGKYHEQVRFRGLWLGEQYVAGMMLFVMEPTQVLHAQYIAPNEEIQGFQPTTSLDIHILREAAKDGFKKFSWGISTEDGGNYLNKTLLKFKESFGAKPVVNAYYTKEF